MTRTRYVIHARTNGTLRTIYADSERTAVGIERALHKDPDSIHVSTERQEVRLHYGQVGAPAKRSFLPDILVGVAILLALLYGIGAI